MTDSELRRVIYKNHKKTRELLLAKNQVSILNLAIGFGTMTTDRLSTYTDISLQNASGQLRKLFEKGYLTREKIVSDSGGIEYIYKSCI